MFIRFELLTLILALTLGGQVHTGKIIGGQVAQSRPYMVLLEYHETGHIKHCGGFLLNADFVMTAAHCQSCSYKVFLGVKSLSNIDARRSLSVEKSYPHENYTGGLGNDIMLLKLSSQPILSKTVKPIAIACQDDEFLPKSCSTSGWGGTVKNERFMSRELMEANVTLINDKQCNEDKLYCSKGEPRPAPGDSGGPLVCEGEKAYGVVSAGFQYTKDSPLFYGYTKIAEYSNWIHSIMGSSDTCNN
ncbi:granzyme G-like [Notothenia coriiceps]|uniref:trypsin n=1 Tax=Notothenia coriiceps TaxID=8208 RepID=A0A6I9NFZ7_9TELE|nr:PREDICTED: granzyme G-like [Notothenia coriiceps]